MFRCLLKAKIHMATVSSCILQYEGSIRIDEDIMEASGMLPYEQVHVSNFDNGKRFITYIIPGKRGSKEFILNGPTARMAVPGDKIIIFSYSWVEEERAAIQRPKILIMDDNNNIAIIKEG